MKEARTSFTGFRSLPMENKMAKNEATKTPAAPPPAASLAEQAAAIPVHPNAPTAPTDLPEKLESVVAVRMESKQRKLYDACEQKLREELTVQRKERKKNRELPPELRRPSVEVLAELTRLRQVCCDLRLVSDTPPNPNATIHSVKAFELTTIR